jgi:hypothetical protein
MSAFIAGSVRSEQQICNLVYQTPYGATAAYKYGTGRLHPGGEMGTDAAKDFDERHPMPQNNQHH